MARKLRMDMTADPNEFVEAVNEFSSRRVITREEADSLEGYARKRAWWISGLAQMDVANDAHQSILDAIRDGKTFEDWKKEAREKIEKAWGRKDSARLLLIFRNATTSAYNAGREEQMGQPHIVAVRPYKTIDVVEDERTCPVCGKLANPPVILPENDPWWLTNSPQYHHACRCGPKSLRRSVAEKLGITTTPPEVDIDQGWGLKSTLAEPPKPSQRKNPPDPDIQLEAAIKAGKDARERKPVAIPKRLVSPKLTASDIMNQRVADASGSNPGGVFIGTDGKKRYVKLYTDPSQAAGEHLANKLYADLGLGEVKSVVFEYNGGLAYASEFIEGATPIGIKGLTPELASKALDGLVGDFAVANWDAVGLSLDNIVVTKAGEVIRIDNGGSFLMRAQAGRKSEEACLQLREWNGFFDRNINPSYSRLANTAGANSANDLLDRIEKQLGALKKLEESSGGWGQYVRTHAPLLNEQDRDAIVKMLTWRTRLIGEKLDAAKLEEAKKKLLKVRKPRKPPAKRLRLAELDAEQIPKFPETWPGAMPNPENAVERTIAREAILERSRAEIANFTTAEERQAISVFTGSSYGSIRAAARLTKEEYSKSANNSMRYELAREYADLITSALEKHEKTVASAKRIAGESAEMFRGIRNVPKAKFEEILNYKTVTWSEPTSTSWTPNVARDFYEPQSGDAGYSVMFRVRHAKSTKGLSIEGVSILDNEHEILFGNDVEFKVTKVVRDANFDRGAIVYLEEI